MTPRGTRHLLQTQTLSTNSGIKRWVEIPPLEEGVREFLLRGPYFRGLPL